MRKIHDDSEKLEFRELLEFIFSLVGHASSRERNYDETWCTEYYSEGFFSKNLKKSKWD